MGWNDDDDTGAQDEPVADDGEDETGQHGHVNRPDEATEAEHVAVPAHIRNTLSQDQW